MSEISQFIFAISPKILSLGFVLLLLYQVTTNVPIWAIFVILFLYVLFTDPVFENKENNCILKTTESVCKEFFSGNTSCSNLIDLFEKDAEWEEYKSAFCNTNISDPNRLLNGYSNDYFFRCPDEILEIREKINTFSKNDCKNVENDSTFLADVVVSSSYGWTVQSFSKSIYDEIINTGKLGIISNIEVRNSISQLYNYFQLYERVSLPRTSDYSQVVYSVVPMESDVILKRGLGDKEQKDMVNTLMNLNLNKYIIFEQNRIRFLRLMYDGAEKSITEVKIKIESDLGK